MPACDRKICPTRGRPAIALGAAAGTLVALAVGLGQPGAPLPQLAPSAAAEPANNRFVDGATLKTSADPLRLLARAEQSAAEGRYDLASALWQKVLDEAGDTLTSSDGRFYTSLAEQVEGTLARLPRVGLETYRTSADAEARALVAAAGPAGEEEALARIVRRYFLSSLGDDAAFKLACLALDRHDFVGASRLLAKILERHPDPSIPRAELWLRVAVAAAHMGDRNAAEQALVEARRAPGERPAADVFDRIAADVAAARSTASGAAAGGTDWPIALGNPARQGHMPALPSEATSRTLSELWVREFSLVPPPGAPVAGAPATGPVAGLIALRGAVVLAGGRVVTADLLHATPTRDELISRWRRGAWRPTGQLLFESGRVYMKSPDRLLCFGARALGGEPLWQSGSDNRYEVEATTQQLAMFHASVVGRAGAEAPPRPQNRTEVLLFGDRVHQSMTLAGGVVFTIEGRREAGPPAAPRAVNLPYPSAPRRTRHNWLVAYDPSSGTTLWSRPAGDEETSSPDKGPLTSAGFLSAGVPCGSLLLVPVVDGGTLWLLGIERASGKTAWRTYLCDEPAGGVSPWAEPLLAVDGRDVYVACGAGVVFALDGITGNIRWAVRYPRDVPVAEPSLISARRQAALSLDPHGWDDDVVLPAGRALVVMASDSDLLFALDRRTAEVLWESPRSSPLGTAASYCLGIRNNGLFVAGRNVVRRYDLAGGRLLWETEVEDSFGRGCLTAEAIYMPVKDSILKLDLERGRELAQVGVTLTSDEPVGNLFSDGEKLWAVGAGRVYAMTTLEHRLATLAARIAAGDADAQLDRMRLLARQQQWDAALADLRAAYRLLAAQQPADGASLRLFAAMDELKLPQTRPLAALDLLRELLVEAPSLPLLGKEAARRRSEVLTAALATVREQKPAASVPALVAIAPLLVEDSLLAAATQALDAVATDADRPALAAALAAGPPTAQLMALRPAVRLASDETKAQIRPLLKSSDERVRLAAARALANLRERAEVLETLVALLDAESVAVRAKSHQSLAALTGQKIVFVASGRPEERAQAKAAWQAWVAASGQTAEFKLPLVDQSVPLGRLLFVAQGQNLLYELDAQRNERWRLPLAGPAWGCQGLPNGHRLVAIYSHATVIEYDHEGQIAWKKDRLPGAPYSVQRLDNGNTLVACADVQKIVEILPDGTVRAIPVAGRPICAQRLENGNTLVALQQVARVVELNGEGQIVWEAHTTVPPAHCQRLASGNTLVTLTSGRAVVEFDPTGKSIVWRTRVPLVNPTAAQRLASGNTLVADYQGLHEIDASGEKIVWQHRPPAVTGRSGVPQITGLSSF